MNHAQDEALPNLVGRYRLQKRIGAGGMGEVYTAYDRLAGEIVAYKRLKFGGDDDLDEIDLEELSMMDTHAALPTLVTISELDTPASPGDFKFSLTQEFQTAATLRHPNIVSVLDYGFDEDGQPYFTMEFLENAADILQVTTGLPLEEKIDYVIQLVQAIAYLHRRGVIHRDLKPDNVLVSNGQVKVLDFGLAAQSDQSDENHFTGGTPSYMAPEVVRGGEISEASDYYAIGVMLFEILTETRFYPSYDFTTLLQLIIEYEPDLYEYDLPIQIRSLIDSLIAKDIEDRLIDPQKLTGRLGKFSAGNAKNSLAVANRESFLQAAKFVGREDELSQLKYSLKLAQQGRGSVWLIGGESGVGKSRLVDEVRIQALVQGGMVLQGQAVEDMRGLPYALWREVVSRLVLTRDIDNLSAGVLKAITPDIETLIGRRVGTPPPLAASNARQRLHSTVTNLFMEQNKVIVLILEDLQWSNYSIEILQQLNRIVHNLGLLIMATYRSDERPDLPEMFPQANQIQLERFTSDEILALSRAMLGQSANDDSLQEVLNRETEGNAFFLVEVVRELAERVGDLNKIHRAEFSEKILPQGIASIIEKRLSRVPESAQRLLQIAALAGRQLDSEIVRNLFLQERPGDDLERWYSVCSDAAVLEIYNGVWRFTHDKIRNGLLSSIDELMEQGFHGQIAEVIEQTYPDDYSFASNLVYHYNGSKNEPMERLSAKKAGAFAEERFLNEDAIQYYERALELTDSIESQERLGILLNIEDIYHLVGMREKQSVVLDEILETAKRCISNGLPEAEVIGLMRKIKYHVAVSEYPEALTTGEHLREEAEEIERIDLRAEGEMYMGEALMRQGHYKKALKILEAVLETSHELQLDIVTGQSYELTGTTLITSSQPAAALPYLEKALPIYRALNLKQKEATIYNNMGISSQAQGRYEEAIEFWESGQKIFQEIGNREGNARILTNLAALNLDLGDFESALHYGKRGLDACREINTNFGECINLLNLGLASFFLKQESDSEVYCHAAIFIAETLENAHMLANAHRELGLILSHLGRLSEALMTYEHVLEIAEKIEQPILMHEARAGIAHVLLQDGEHILAHEVIMPTIDYLMQEKSLEGAAHPFRIFQVCYLLMLLDEDPRAGELLDQAYVKLVARTERIRDPEKRKYYEDILEHRQLLRAYDLALHQGTY